MPEELPTLDHAAFEAFASQPGVSLVDFTAVHCGPCRVMKPVLAALSIEYARHVRIAAVDCDDEPQLAERYLVRSMPTMVVLRDGREVGRIVGSRPRAFVAGVLDRALGGDVAITGP